MKTLLVVGILLVGISGQAFSMGHPHNMFAARKQLRAKASSSVAKTKLTTSTGWQHAVHATKTTFGDQVLAALSHLHPARSY